MRAVAVAILAGLIMRALPGASGPWEIATNAAIAVALTIVWLIAYHEKQL